MLVPPLKDCPRVTLKDLPIPTICCEAHPRLYLNHSGKLGAAAGKETTNEAVAVILRGENLVENGPDLSLLKM